MEVYPISQQRSLETPDGKLLRISNGLWVVQMGLVSGLMQLRKLSEVGRCWNNYKIGRNVFIMTCDTKKSLSAFFWFLLEGKVFIRSGGLFLWLLFACFLLFCWLFILSWKGWWSFSLIITSMSSAEFVFLFQFSHLKREILYSVLFEHCLFKAFDW